MTEQAPQFPWKDKVTWIEMVLAAPDLTPAMKVIGIRVVLHLNAFTLQCNPSVATICRGTNLKERAVRDNLKAIRDRGYLDYPRNPGGHHHETNNYWPTTREPRVRGGAAVNRGGCKQPASNPHEASRAITSHKHTGAPPRKDGCVSTHPTGARERMEPVHDGAPKSYTESVTEPSIESDALASLATDLVVGPIGNKFDKSENEGRKKEDFRGETVAPPQTPETILTRLKAIEPFTIDSSTVYVEAKDAQELAFLRQYEGPYLEIIRGTYLHVTELKTWVTNGRGAL